MSADARIAILIDGGFFIRRLPKLVGPNKCSDAEKTVSCIRWLCRRHVKNLTGYDGKLWHRHIYRVFYYDAEPYDGKAHHPIQNHPIDYKKSQQATSRRALFDELRKQRKLALRLGKVNKESDWQIDSRLTKKILRHQPTLAHLDALKTVSAGSPHNIALSADQVTELLELQQQWQAISAQDVQLGLKQKGVDTRIAIDMVSIALKQQARTLVLVTGDSDFVPAAKLARREGLEIILDSLWQQVNEDLHEHIDGRYAGLKKPVEST